MEKIRNRRLTVSCPAEAGGQMFPEHKVPVYDIVFSNTYNELSAQLEKLELSGHKALLLTDSNVGGYYLDTVQKALTLAGLVVFSMTVEAGEARKNLDTIQVIYEYMIEKHMERRDMVFALGGGVIGDMAGFAAATYLRGIRFVQLPTSLLAMVDSSIGGKTGVDFKAYKNMVGAFHQPSAVYINSSVLKTLPKREYLSGFGEILKHGLIRDAVYFDWLLEHCDEMAARKEQPLVDAIETSCRIKRAVVENDPGEQGERAILNFGHTIGHAIERLMDFSLLHGECVALGMAGAAYISKEKQLLSEAELDKIVFSLEKYHLLEALGRVQEKITAEQVLETMKLDKKMQDGRVRFILLQGIGNAVISRNVTEAELRSGIEALLEGGIL